MATRKRSESGTKRQYKGKCLTMYESIFKGEDLMASNPNFWSELFLIKPTVSHIENEISRLNEETILLCKQNINSLVSHCIDALSDENAYRIVYSMQTLSAVLFSLYKKANHNEKAFNFIDISFGLENIEERMTTLLQHINIFLTGKYTFYKKFV